MKKNLAGWAPGTAGVIAVLMVASMAAHNVMAQGGGIQIERSFPAIESGEWTGPRLPDGQPDVEGHWSNTIANHNNFTDPQGGIVNDPGASARRIAQSPRENRAPSRVTDPADG